VGRAIGSTLGYTVRSGIGTASEPVTKKVWHERPNLETWQKVLGGIAWPVMVLLPHGWVFLAGTFLVMVVLGDYNPYQWAVWVTKWGGIFLAITVILIVLVYAIALSSQHTGGLIRPTGL
jgi:energy-coupling factor transporter transmembrane protein EcfT